MMLCDHNNEKLGQIWISSKEYHLFHSSIRSKHAYIDLSVTKDFHEDDVLYAKTHCRLRIHINVQLGRIRL